MSYVLKALIASLAVASVSLTAHSKEPIVNHVMVSYAELDLSKERGADQMLRRLDRAASQACGGKPALGPLDLSTRSIYKACVHGALVQAIADLNHPMVSQMYAKRRSVKAHKVAAR